MKSQSIKDLKALKPNAKAHALDVMHMHLPDILAQRIEAGHSAFLNEIRVCTVLFIGFPSLTVSDNIIVL